MFQGGTEYLIPEASDRRLAVDVLLRKDSDDDEDEEDEAEIEHDDEDDDDLNDDGYSE